MSYIGAPTIGSWKDTINWRKVLNSLNKQELIEIILLHDMRGEEE